MKNTIASICLVVLIGCTAAQVKSNAPVIANSVVTIGCIEGSSRANASDKAKVIKGLETAILILETNGTSDLEANIKIIDKSVAPYAADIANWVIFLRNSNPTLSENEFYKLVDSNLNKCLDIFDGDSVKI